MDAMRADMGGAATVCSAIVTAAALKLPINIIGPPTDLFMVFCKQRYTGHSISVRDAIYSMHQMKRLWILFLQV